MVQSNFSRLPLVDRTDHLHRNLPISPCFVANFRISKTIKMNVTVENTKGDLIDITIEEYNTEYFLDCCETENIQRSYARGKYPEKKPGVNYKDKIVKAYIDKKARKLAGVTESNAAYLCSKSIEKFTEDKYQNKKFFFIELMSHTPYDMQYHYLIEE